MRTVTIYYVHDDLHHRVKAFFDPAEAEQVADENCRITHIDYTRKTQLPTHITVASSVMRLAQ